MTIDQATLGVDMVLTKYTQGFKNDKYIFDKILPITKTDKPTVKFGKHGIEHRKLYTLHRAPGTTIWRVQPTMSTETKELEQYAIEVPMPEEIGQVATNPPVNDKKLATNTAIAIMNNNLEYAISTIMGTASNYGSTITLSGTAQWSDHSTSATGNPIEDIETAKRTVRQASGKVPNTLIMSYDVWSYLSTHPEVLKRYSSITPYNMTPEEARKLFGIPNIIVGESSYADSSGSNVDMWGKWCAVCYINKVDMLYDTSFGKMFRLNGYPIVRRYFEDNTAQTVIQLRDYILFAILNTAAGYLIIDAIA